MQNIVTCLLTSLLLSAFPPGLAGAEPVPIPIRIAVLKFGTVNWTLEVIKHHQLDKKHGIDLEIIPLGSKNASHVALQGDGADMIVSDWLWVSRQRAENHDYTFVPYSNATGALMVKKDSGIDTLADLSGKKLGIAGGPVDKSWLFLRAYAQKTQGTDLADLVEPTFAAPPLLNMLGQRGDLEGVLTFWHYTARLEASGFKPVVTVSEALKALGIEGSVPVIGWVFSDKWAEKNTDIVNAFIEAARAAQQRLIDDDVEWDRIRHLMKAKNDEIFNALRNAYRRGVPVCFGEDERNASKAAYNILVELGGNKLVGDSTTLNEGTFWKSLQAMDCMG